MKMEKIICQKYFLYVHFLLMDINLIKISKYLVLGIETLMIIQQMYHLFSIHSLRAFVPDSANE